MTLHRIRWIATVLAILGTQTAPAAKTPACFHETSFYLSLGYSIGVAFNADAPDDRGLADDRRGTEPLIAIGTKTGRGKTFQTEILLALANYGNLISVTPDATGGAPAPTDSTLATVRRSVLADLTLRRHLAGDKQVGTGFYATFNTGFLFDAQNDADSTNVADASSYVFVGPSFRTLLSTCTEVEVDFLVGQSEIMTGKEPFSRGWGDGRTVRFRPRIVFNLLSDGDPKPNSFTPLTVGFWADLGTSEETADTFAVFFSRPFWSQASP